MAKLNLRNGVREVARAHATYRRDDGAQVTEYKALRSDGSVLFKSKIERANEPSISFPWTKQTQIQKLTVEQFIEAMTKRGFVIENA